MTQAADPRPSGLVHGVGAPARPHPDPLWAAIDVPHFAAQALARARPELRDRPFAVIEQRGDHHKASVHALSAAALDMGAVPGCPVFVLRRRFGRRIPVVRRDGAAEEAALEQLLGALGRWTPDVETRRDRGTVRVVADLTGTPATRVWRPETLGEQLQQHLRRQCALTASIGLAAGRLAARLVAGGVDVGRVLFCPADEEQALLRNLAMDDLPGLSSAVRERAALYGLGHVEQLLQLDRAALVRRFGREDGLRLYGLARGLDPGRRSATASGVEATTVLEHDIVDDAGLRQALHLTVDRACHEIRSARQVSRAITVRLGYSDGRSSQKTAVLPASTDGFATLCAAADALFGDLHTRRVALKSVTVRLGRMTPTTGQGDLFAAPDEARRQRLGVAITDIRQRMGFDAVHRATDRLPAGGKTLL